MYLLHLGLLLVLPFVMELWLEFDLRQALSSLARDWIALSPIFHLFTMQTNCKEEQNVVTSYGLSFLCLVLLLATAVVLCVCGDLKLAHLSARWRVR